MTFLCLLCFPLSKNCVFHSPRPGDEANEQVASPRAPASTTLFGHPSPLRTLRLSALA